MFWRTCCPRNFAGALGFSAAVGLIVALWTASRGMSVLITALDIAYKEHERRSFLKLSLIALVLAIGLVLCGLVVIAFVAVLPAALQFLSIGATAKWLGLVIRWPLLIVVVMRGLAVLDRYAPDRDEPQ
jgi:membrane protein